MKDLIQAIIGELTDNLDYLQNVQAIDSVLAPPSEKGFPCVGIKDGDEVFESQPNQRDKKIMTVTIAIYQQLFDGEKGTAILGSAPERGDRFKGLIEIAYDVRARLNDNHFDSTFDGKIYWAHIDKIAGSETLGDEEQPLMQMKLLTVTYRRFS